jgi:hypothetical protein
MACFSRRCVFDEITSGFPTRAPQKGLAKTDSFASDSASRLKEVDNRGACFTTLHLFYVFNSSPKSIPLDSENTVTAFLTGFCIKVV